MSRIATLRESVLWAAGNETARFALRAGEVDEFLMAVKLHRLTGRLVRRLRREPPGPARELLDEAERAHDVVKRDTLAKVDVAVRLGRALRKAGRDEPVVVLKGFTLYALTGDPLDLRFSNDLDVNVADLDGLIEAAASLGFVKVRPDEHLAEYAVMQSPTNGVVEIHSRFDVTRLASDVTRDDVAPERHTGVWEQRQYFRVKYLRHADFCEQLATSPIVPGELRPLRPEIAALVVAAHVFKNFLRFPYPVPIATIPLDEVATFVDLCRLPSFEAARFAALVERVDGQDAVRFARALAKDLLGMNVPLPAEARAASDRLFPISLWWDGLDGGGFPVDAGWDPGQLVYRDRPLSQLVDKLGSSEITGLGNGHGCSFRLLGEAGGHQGGPERRNATGADEIGTNGSATRYIFRKDPGNPFMVECVLSGGTDGWLLTFVVPTIPDDRMVAIAVVFQDHRYEIFLNTRVRDPFFDYSTRPEGAEQVAMTRLSRPDADVVELRLPAQIVEHCQVDGVIHGLIVVREQIREWSRMTAGAAVPVRIPASSAAPDGSARLVSYQPH